MMQLDLLTLLALQALLPQGHWSLLTVLSALPLVIIAPPLATLMALLGLAKLALLPLALLMLVLLVILLLVPQVLSLVPLLTVLELLLAMLLAGPLAHCHWPH